MTQASIRITPAHQGTPFTQALAASYTGPAAVLAITALPLLFFVSSLAVPALRRTQRRCVDSQTAHTGFGLYVLGHIANCFVVTPLVFGVLFGAALAQLCTAPVDDTAVASYAVYSVLGLAFCCGAVLLACFVSLYLMLPRPTDPLTCSSSLLHLAHPVALALTVAAERLKPAAADPACRVVLLLLTAAGLAWVLACLALGVRHAVFHSPAYRIITLLGLVAAASTLVLHAATVLAPAPPTLAEAALWLCTAVGLSAVWLARPADPAFVSPRHAVASTSQLSRLEELLWERRLALEPSFRLMLLDLQAEGVARLPCDGPPATSAPGGTAADPSETRTQLLAQYVFELYHSTYATAKHTQADAAFTFAFAHFLLRWKKHIYLLSVLHRSLLAAPQSLRHSVAVAVLETAVTRQLRTQDAQFSYFYSAARSPTPPAARAVHLGAYHIIEAVSAFERLVGQMRLQLRLQSQFLAAVESQSQQASQVHAAVAAITRQRAHCKQLFESLHADADAAQTFHLLPFAFFIEHTENNLERRVELVKSYYFKSGLRRVHTQVFCELVDRAVTVVSESERSRLGLITHSSKNAGLVFGTEVAALEGRSLDVFFHAEMAAAHRRQMRHFMQTFEQPYLGDYRERYVTVGNHIYYRVETVTKFVPHIRDGFKFVTMLKQLTEDAGRYGKLDDAGIQLILDDKMKILGIGYNHSLLKNYAENDDISRNAASTSKGLATNRFAVTAALSILPEIQGKALASLSADIADKVRLCLAGLHEELKKAQDLIREIDLGEANTTVKLAESEVPIKDGLGMMFAQKPVSNKLMKPELPKQGCVPLESGNFIVSIDMVRGMVISEIENEDSNSEEWEGDQVEPPEPAVRAKIPLLLNLTHFCLVDETGPSTNQAKNPLRSTERQGQESHMYTMKVAKDSNDAMDDPTNMLADHENVRTESSSHVGFTILRIQNPNKINLEALQQDFGQLIDRKNSFVDVGGEFDPLKFLAKLINLRNCQDIIQNYMSRPEIAELNQIKQEGMNDDHRVQLSGEVSPLSNPDVQKSSTQIFQRHVLADNQIQLVIPNHHSTQRTVSLDNNIVSKGSSETRAVKGSHLLAKEELLVLDRNNSITNKPTGRSAGLPQDSARRSQPSDRTGKSKTIAGAKSHKKGILGSQFQNTAKFKSRTAIISQKPYEPAASNGDIEDERSQKSVARSHSRSKGKSQIKDPMLNTKPSAVEDLAASVGGQSIASSRMSEININRTLWLLIGRPSANNSSKVVVFFVMLLFWTFCHTYQTIMLDTFSKTFNGIADLQNLFGIFINFDTYAKASVVNIIEREMTFDPYGAVADRYSRYNPLLVDITEASQREVSVHLNLAHEHRQYMVGNLSLLLPTEVSAFTDLNLVKKNLTVRTSEDQNENLVLIENYFNPLQVSLMVLYDLRVWNEDITNYGSWAALNFYHDSIEGWFQFLKKTTETFGQQYTAKIKSMETTSLYFSVGGIVGAQILIFILLRQINNVRIGIVKNISVVQSLKLEEVAVKLHRLAVLDDYLSKEIYVGSDCRKSIAPVVSSLNKLTRSRLESEASSGRKEKAARDVRKQQNKAIKKDRMIALPQKAAKYGKSSASKVKSTFMEWFGMGIFALLLVLAVEFQSLINFLTASKQRSISDMYLHWLDNNEHYYLLTFALNNIPTTILIDNSGDLGLFDLLSDLHPFVAEYMHTLDLNAVALVKHVLSIQEQASAYGYQKFFQNPCDLIDLSIYNLPKDSCNSLNAGVIQTGYIRFMDIERLNFMKLNDVFHHEQYSDYHTCETKEFLEVAFHVKNIHQLMFPLIIDDILQAAQNFNQIAWEYTMTYGIVLESILTVVGFVVCFIWMFVADAKLSTAVSLYLIIPAESLALNHQVRAQIKNLFDRDNLN